MKVKLRNGKAAPEESILAAETRLGYVISTSFRTFLRTQDGAEPETNIFRVSTRNDSGVNRFIPVTEIGDERTRIESIPAKGYPVAWAEGGNYVFIDEAKHGAVFFWDHEEPEDPVELAGSFDAFLNLLEPFDIKSIELKPGQVKRVWVDPEFLKKLKE